MVKKEVKMFPHKITPIEENLNRQLMSDFKGERYGFVQVGTKKWCLPAIFEKHAGNFYNFTLRPDDIWLLTFPRSGTTLCQELIWLLNNNFDYETSSKVAMEQRFPFYEYTILQTERLHEEISKMNNNDPIVNAKLEFWRKPVYEYDMSSPRHFKTHLPFSLLPQDLTKKCKTIYIARNPKDVAVSYFHHNRLLRVHDYKGDFNKYWKYFMDDLVVFAPYWEHIKEGWEMRHNKNVLFLFYEDININMEAGIRKVANFLEKPVNDEQISKLKEHLKIENFRKAVPLKELNIKGTKNDGEQDFCRKGQVGGNTEFDEQLNKAADEWIKRNTNGTDLNFSTVV